MENKLFLIPISASIAEICTYPIDYVKTLIQVNKKGGFVTFFSKTISENRFMIYSGIKPALLRHLVYSTLRVSIYEKITETKSLNSKFLIGGVSGAISQFIASPFDLLKVRYITNKHLNNSIYYELKGIIKENGFYGLWKGATPNIMRGSLVNFGELATYQISKDNIKKNLNLDECSLLHFLSSLSSGFAGAICCTPADVIKSRLMKKNSEYSGIIDCTKKTILNEGIFAMYKGFIPIWLRLAPWQIIFWTSYEKLRSINGINNF